MEVNQLREEFQRSNEAISNLTEQNKLSQNRLHDVTHEYNKIHSDKQEISEEMQALERQFPTLKAKVLEAQEALKNETKEKEQFEVQLANKTQLFHLLENEISSIKQSLSKGVHEVKDIEGRYLGLVNEKASLYNRSAQLEQMLERHNSDIKILQNQLEEAGKKEDVYNVQISELEAGNLKKHQEAMDEFRKRIQDLEDVLQKHHDQLHEKETEIEENNSQILLLSQEKIRLEDTLSNLTRYQDEQDARIKVAQQHLGKKVKEATLMNEKMEEQKVQISELQASLNQMKTKMMEMQNSFDLQIQQEKKHQEQLHETVRFSEGQIVKWEEKYLKTYDKLKVLEEKQHQMQALLSSLGNVISSHSVPHAQASFFCSSAVSPHTKKHTPFS